MAKKTTGKDAEHDALLKELRGLITQLDDEGLIYLAEQAKIHIYNMNVDKHNAEVIAVAQKAGKKAAKTAGRKGTGKSEGAGTARGAAGFSISGTPSGSSFYLRYGTSDIMFSGSEMTRLVKIVNGPGTDIEISERLYNWFDRERRDIFALANMKNKFDDRLKDLAAVIKNNIKLAK